MFDVPMDATYAWVGVALVSVATLGVAATLPATPPPDATGVAGTVDRVALGEHPATAEHGIATDEIRISPDSLALAGPGGTAHATLAGPRITPAGDDHRLERVLHGEPPERVFATPNALAAAAVDARERGGRWETAPDRLRIRQVHWGETRVTLVG